VPLPVQKRKEKKRKEKKRKESILAACAAHPEKLDVFINKSIKKVK
jgi:hypothetical protein